MGLSLLALVKPLLRCVVSVTEASPVVLAFVQAYLREQDFYYKLAEICARKIEPKLRESNIRAITSWRAKRPDRLLRKLQERDATRLYEDRNAITEDIGDLAGARVALYFPSDRGALETIVEESFRVIVKKSLPEADAVPRPGKRFPGYAATHYRVRLMPESLSPEETRYADATCEIQIASVLMHAWAEVGHDLEYKMLSGTASLAESALLDQINGLVMVGEISLEQLRILIEQRLKGSVATLLRDQYDLAAWLRALFPDGSAGGSRSVGRADMAFRMLEYLGMTSGEPLRELQKMLVAEPAKMDQSLVELMVESLLKSDPSRRAQLVRAQADLRATERMTVPEATNSTLDSYALGEYLSRWRLLEQVVSELRPGIRVNQGLRELFDLPRDTANKIYDLWHMRHRAVHAVVDPPQTAELLEGAQFLDGVIEQLHSRLRDRSLESRLEKIVVADGRKGEMLRGRDDGSQIEVQAGPAILLAERHAMLVPLTVANRSESSDSVVAMALIVGSVRIAPTVRVDGLEISGLRYLAAPLRLESGGAVVGALNFDLSSEQTTLVMGRASVELKIKYVHARQVVVAMPVRFAGS